MRGVEPNITDFYREKPNSLYVFHDHNILLFYMMEPDIIDFYSAPQIHPIRRMLYNTRSIKAFNKMNKELSDLQDKYDKLTAEYF
jgi:hypothetical protein